MQIKFNIESIPQLENPVEEATKKTLDIIQNNYKQIIEDFIKLIDISIDKISKPITLFNLFFIVEIWAKYYLIYKSFMDINHIEGKKHGLKDLFRCLYIQNFDCSELEEMLKNFKDKDRNCLNIDTYYDFKYNKKRNKEDIIFDYEYFEDEKERVKDVIEWIGQYLWH